MLKSRSERVSSRGFWLTLATVLAVTLVVLSPARADDWERKVKETQRRVEALVKAGRQLQELDREAAQHLFERAEELQAKLRHATTERRRQYDEVEVFEGLVAGMKALQALGRHEEAKRLEEIVGGLKRELAGREKKAAHQNAEVKAAKWQLEVMKVATRALKEAGRGDAAELMERAVRALAVGLEGRRDDEAAAIRKRAPSRVQKAELLMLASRVLAERDQPDRAEMVGKLARQMAERAQRRHQGKSEREVVLKQNEVMRLAIHALLEEGRQDLAHQVEQKIHASELALEGRRDEKALRSRETAPSSGQMAEILGYAANLWKKWDKQERATKVWDLSRHFLEQHNRGRVSRKKLVAAEREHGQRRDKEAGRLEHLQKQVAELRHALERLRAELGELRRNPN